MRNIVFFVFVGMAVRAQTYVNGSRTVDGTVNYCSDSGSTDAYACSISPSISAYVAGATYGFRANTANVGAASINFNGMGARAIRKNGDQDLADNDIKPGQIVFVTYDGASMQMQSQLGNAAVSGGGGGGGAATTVINTAGQGYWSPFGDGAGTYIFPTVIDHDLRVWQVTLPFKATFGKANLYIQGSSGTGCSGGVCGLVVGMYDATCTNLLGFGRAVSGGSPNINAVGPISIPLASAVTLDAGTYFMAVSTDSGNLSLYAKDIGGWGSMVNLSAPRYGKAANNSTGSGSSLAFPATCGAINSAGALSPAISVWER